MIKQLLPLTISWNGARIFRDQAWDLLQMNSSEAFRKHFPKLNNAQIIKLTQQYADELDWCLKYNIEVIPFFSPKYPEQLWHLEKPPLLLTTEGDLSKWDYNISMTIVGTRNPSLNMLSWMDREVGEFLTQRPFQIISGGARGVDQKAHSIALRKNCATFCFLPSGLRNVYPANLNNWKKLIVATGGALISSYAPSSVMQKRNFSERNHLMAAMSPLSLIVGARARSGTMITARAASSLGRELGILPDFPSEFSAGGLSLLKDGAHMVTDAMDLLALTGKA